jgi:hypothetical protein
MSIFSAELSADLVGPVMVLEDTFLEDGSAACWGIPALAEVSFELNSMDSKVQLHFSCHVHQFLPTGHIFKLAQTLLPNTAS